MCRVFSAYQANKLSSDVNQIDSLNYYTDNYNHSEAFIKNVLNYYKMSSIDC